MIGDGVIIDGARVEHSGLLKGSGASRSALVKESVLGVGTSVSRGEVIASLVGPGTGFHHEALLISALWPEGRGNVGYGAMVGSNHTGRMPDQEVRPGEGAFFGLGCCVKFPCNFEAAPYTLVAAGLTLLPQRLAQPAQQFPGQLGSCATQALGSLRRSPRPPCSCLPREAPASRRAAQ